MMKDLLQQMAAYNLWAHTQIAEVLNGCSEEELAKDLGGSFGSIRETARHLWQAESIWWQRLKLADNIIIPGSDGGMATADLIQGLLRQSQVWADWVIQASEAALQHEFIYQNSKRESFKNPVCQVLIHVFNHATYHRGQIINYLRQLGKTRVPATDFIAFTRRK
jgi:uncharacterized damage-inducible protein DinB